MSAQVILYAIIAAFSCLLLSLNLILHIRAKTLPLIILTTIVIISNALNLLNLCIWHDNDRPNWFDGRGLCDVEVKLYIGIEQAVIGAVATLLHQLAGIIRTEGTVLVPSKKDRRHQLYFNLIFCFILPTYVMAAHYIVQPNRYGIRSFSGCRVTMYQGWLTMILIYTPDLITTVIAITYAVLLIIRLVRYRQQTSIILANSISTTNKNRFTRLFTLSILLLLVRIPTTVFNIIYSSRSAEPYSWQAVHPPYWSYLISYESSSGQISYRQWILAITGWVIFALFGFGQESKSMFKGWWLNLKQKLKSGHIRGADTFTATATIQQDRNERDIELQRSTIGARMVGSFRPSTMDFDIIEEDDENEEYDTVNTVEQKRTRDQVTLSSEPDFR